MRGNATLIALVVIAAMTTTAMQLWRLASYRTAIIAQRQRSVKVWFALNACFEAAVCTLQASFDAYAQVAQAQGVVSLSMPVGLAEGAVVSATMQYTKQKLFVIAVSMVGPFGRQLVRFLVEKQTYAQAPAQLLVHHVTFGALV
jgi:hypothetical protein